MLHSQLIEFSFRPAKFVGLEFNFEKEDHSLQHCLTFEEFIAGIIKDKPANIDVFFDTYVKRVEVVSAEFMDYCKQLAVVAGGLSLEPVVQQIQVPICDAVDH